MYKKVKYLIPVYDVDMGGIRVKQALPTQNVNQVDPFLLLHHGAFNFRDHAPAIQQGLGPHPHRGFTPVSFVIEGEVHHRDSRGNSQIAKKGEVQWMSAGAGIIHSERPSQDLADKNGTQEVIQLWINSPASNKMNPPRYQYVSEKDIPLFESEDYQIRNKLIAGSLNGLAGKIETESDLLIIWSEAKAGGSQTFTVANHFNSMLYLIRGELKIGGYGKVDKETLVVFENQPGAIEVSSGSDAQFLILAGAPLNEKVVQHGPYVMNTETEILEAMRDYQKGKMGILVEEE
jgi:redox-sensitive bicupin YhaK (pirin superfamily)